MPERLVVIRNPSGLHARPAATFVKAAARFDAEIRIANLDRDPRRAVSAKSVLEVMTIGAAPGHRVQLTADGPDAGAALSELVALVDAGLGEAAEGGRSA